MLFPPSLETSIDLFFVRGYRAAQRLLPPEGEEKEKRQAVEPVGHRSQRRVAQRRRRLESLRPFAVPVAL
jgi:hypothetical protein